MIVVIGDIAVDIVSTLRAPLARGSDAAARIQVMPGGSGANVAVWLARLGRDVTFIGRVGDDLFGRWLADDLAREHVCAALITDPVRGTGVIQVLVEPGGERTMVPDRGANAVWSGDEVPQPLIAGAELLHVVGYVLLDGDSQPGALQAMKYARMHGVPISLDPSSHAPLLARGPESFWSLVGHVDVLLPNRAEAQVLSGETDPEHASFPARPGCAVGAGVGEETSFPVGEETLAALHAHASVVAIKLDRDGCLASDRVGRWRVPAPSAEIVNATGAGDAFNAAFLARWLQDRDVEAACAAAVALGTHAATLPGTR